jgi:DNA-binding response OmpR family regulator
MAKILIIEDEVDLAELYRIVLGDRGHKVLGPFEDPREPLSLAEARAINGDINLILLDERLGLLSGTSFIHRYRQAFPLAKIALVSADPDAVQEGRSRGADTVLKKPVPLGRLLEHLGLLL